MIIVRIIITYPLDSKTNSTFEVKILVHLYKVVVLMCSFFFRSIQ